MVDRFLPSHLRGLRGLDLLVGAAFEPLALALLPVRGFFFLTDSLREWWWTR